MFPTKKIENEKENLRSLFSDEIIGGFRRGPGITLEPNLLKFDGFQNILTKDMVDPSENPRSAPETNLHCNTFTMAYIEMRADHHMFCEMLNNLIDCKVLEISLTWKLATKVSPKQENTAKPKQIFANRVILISQSDVIPLTSLYLRYIVQRAKNIQKL